MTLFAAVTAKLRLTVRAVFGEVAHLIAVSAFDVVRVWRLGTACKSVRYLVNQRNFDIPLLGDVVFGAAVTAALLAALARSLTVTSVVAGLIAVGAGDGWLVKLATLLRATLRPMSESLITISKTVKQRRAIESYGCSSNILKQARTQQTPGARCSPLDFSASPPRIWRDVALA
ncbi:hypothetical protein BAUCODRAFT_277998 [Baudoinia panamericana UAMH 10762]|uniref:Uncharacterized protein n=1 Tax=Baudoinia panamericana (strain UAMH 10762) TaxID=717646 RepID=M2LDU2_BAUPA|nr:uncharacterized protein BAUCODRAFT_277998 [Baudoinia panamericana UAMH 10762]EMC92147.1 hypothetical protein BAUCODRAFT_277998 [Baudoinia panamericana UAMH 10762]